MSDHIQGVPPSGSGSRASHEAACASSPKASIPNAWLERAFSDRVVLACDAAKAVPGDVWGKGAEGHYAFLCGLAAFLDVRSEMLDDMVKLGRVRRDGFNERHPELAGITGVCPSRIAEELGLAQAIEAQRAETENTGSVEDESAVAKPCAQSDPAINAATGGQQ
jgi:hypothetical protein